MELRGQLHAPATVPLTEEFQVPNAWNQDRSESCEEINLLPLPGIEPLFLDRQAVPRATSTLHTWDSKSYEINIYLVGHSWLLTAYVVKFRYVSDDSTRW
jgi:hypothetical protein